MVLVPLAIRSLELHVRGPSCDGVHRLFRIGPVDQGVRPLSPASRSTHCLLVMINCSKWRDQVVPSSSMRLGIDAHIRVRPACKRQWKSLTIKLRDPDTGFTFFSIVTRKGSSCEWHSRIERSRRRLSEPQVWPTTGCATRGVSKPKRGNTSSLQFQIA
jgi:hypothetical protein